MAMLIFFTIFVVFGSAGYYAYSKKKTAFAKYAVELNKPNIIKKYFLPNSSGGIGYNEIENGLVIISERTNEFGKYESIFLKSSDLISVELREDDEKNIETSTSSAVGRAVVGGLVSGGIGAVIGGATASQTQTETSSNLMLVLHVNNPLSPTISLNFFHSIQKVKKNSFLYKQALVNVEDWKNLISVLIHRNNKL